jgi:hypothetical protein
MSCVSTEGTYHKHLFTIKEHGVVKHRSPTCMRCGAPRSAPPAKQGRVDTDKWPHVYTGPTTPYGLQRNSACRIVGKRNHAVEIETKGGKRWIVPREQVQRAS